MHTRERSTVVDDVRSRRDTDFDDYLVARRSALLRTTYAITGDLNDAEDILQTVLAKAYLAWDRIDDPDAYCRRAIVNTHHSLWRRAFKRRETTMEWTPERTTEDRYDDGTATDLWRFVQTLPRRQREVVVLRFYEDLTETEVADVLGISVGTVKSQGSRALASLRTRTPSSLRHNEEDR